MADNAEVLSSDAIGAAWELIRTGLRRDLGARTFDQWLKPARVSEWLPGERLVRIGLPTAFSADWVANHYAERLNQAWRAVAPLVRAIEIVTTADEAVEQVAAPEAAPKPALPANPTFDPRFTFDAFVTGATNRIACNAARSLGEGGPMHFNPLYVQAATGHGKTHLLHAIGHAYVARSPEARVIYMSAERFMFEFVTAMRARETMAFKTRLRSVDLLMIDDVQFIAGKDSTQEEFLHTVDELLTGGKRLVISSDRGPHELDGVEGRVLSRLTQGLVVDIKPADFELRREIVARKAATIAGVSVPGEVLDLLAGRIASNVRELEGALNRLTGYATLSGRQIDAAFADDVLADMFRAGRRRVTIDEIQKRVSEHFRIRQAEMVSARRAREVARPRQIAMYLAKQLTPRSLPEIGRRFGGRDHTTVIHAVRQIEKLRAADSELDTDVRTLMRVLEG